MLPAAMMPPLAAIDDNYAIAAIAAMMSCRCIRAIHIFRGARQMLLAAAAITRHFIVAAVARWHNSLLDAAAVTPTYGDIYAIRHCCHCRARHKRACRYVAIDDIADITPAIRAAAIIEMLLLPPCAFTCALCWLIVRYAARD